MEEAEKIPHKTFESEEKIDMTGQTEHLYDQRPIWLPKPSISIQAL